MQFEARGLLEELAESTVTDAVAMTEKNFSELPDQMKFLLAVERAEGKLDGIYTFWIIGEEEDRADDAADVIEDIVSDYHRGIANALDIDIERLKSDSNSSDDTNVFET